MHIALIAEHFPPVRSSCAVQVRDLALELRDLGHAVTVLTPDAQATASWSAEDHDGIRIIRLRAWPTRDRNYALRLLGELAMPFLMLWALARSPAATLRFDGIAWYSPNIFFGPLVAALKRRDKARAYLILRDIFPEWAADLGLVRRNLAYRFLQAVARYQYAVADVIGVQTPANLPFFAADMSAGKRVEVLQNWMRTPLTGATSLDEVLARLSGRRIFVYAGNMGVAQGMDKLVTLAEGMRDDPRAGFLFVGRGSEAERLRSEAERRGLDHCHFVDEVDPEEIPALYDRCDFGLVALDQRHTWHNIPGKFISYLHSGLPVLASVNPGNDLVALVERHDVGRVSTSASGSDLSELARAMLDDPRPREEWQARCRTLGQAMFGSRQAAEQIVAGLSPCA